MFYELRLPAFGQLRTSRNLLMKTMIVQALCLALAPLVSLAQPVESAAPSVTAIRAGKFIDTQTGRVLANQIILVRGAKIGSVGANVKIPDDATVIDMSKMTVLPGLVDCHTHLADLHDAEPLVSDPDDQGGLLVDPEPDQVGVAFQELGQPLDPVPLEEMLVDHRARQKVEPPALDGVGPAAGDHDPGHDRRPGRAAADHAPPFE